MIEVDDELAVLQVQLARVEKVIEIWRQRLLPHNPRNFALYAEGAIEQAAKLRAQIDEYLSRRKTSAAAPSSPQSASTAAPHQVS